ncbi:MAG: Flp pilus assembly protein CpaB [Oligoflexia bacterium]|nr:Flp pilus assembly protein CpaB [Oligoflexia bacterium]
MNNKAFTLSLVMAILAVFFVESYVSSLEEETKRKFGTEVLVVVAKRDIKEMETLNETMWEFETKPKKFLESSAVYFEGKKPGDEKVTESLRSLVGAVAVVPIKKGDQITFNKLIEPSVRTGLSPQVTPGRRAVAIPVSETSSVAKLVKPGDRVDLVVVVDMGAGKENKISKTILQDVVVLATGHNVTNNAPRQVEQDSFAGKERVRSLAEDTNFASVTLEVDPLQAQQLALLSNSDSTLILSLRNNDDSDRTNTGSTMLQDVLGADLSRVQRNVAGRR